MWFEFSWLRICFSDRKREINSIYEVKDWVVVDSEKYLLNEWINLFFKVSSSSYMYKHLKSKNYVVVLKAAGETK